MIHPTIIREQALWSEGFIHVAGVDEAGKGPLAGPVTAGAVVIHTPQQVIMGVRDSKYLTEKQRERLFEPICEKSTAWGVGIVGCEEIDSLGIDFAVRKAMLQALSAIEQQLGSPLSFVLVDGSKTKPLEKYPSERIFKGGLYHYSIAAGSILAKVTRDRLMKKVHEKYPEYGFLDHVGYGTKNHMNALKKYGPSPVHRKTFEPIKSMIHVVRT